MCRQDIVLALMQPGMGASLTVTETFRSTCRSTSFLTIASGRRRDADCFSFFAAKEM